VARICWHKGGLPNRAMRQCGFFQAMFGGSPAVQISFFARTANVSKADLTGTQARRDAETADVLAATEQINVNAEAIVVQSDISRRAMGNV